MLNLVIIGCGRISQKHIEASIVNANKVKLVGVCDIIIQRANEKSIEYKKASGNEPPKVFDNYRAMLNEIKCDLVAICTESGYHSKIAIYCMNRGRHVIVEKPMALSTWDADQMVKTAIENNVKLCISHQNRFNPSIVKLRQAVESGRFGRIIAGNARILWNRDKSYYEQARWRGTYKLDGGCLMNQCIHNIDLLQWMLSGNISWVHGDVQNRLHSYIEAEDYGSIQIKFDNGSIGNVEGTVCVYPKNLEETLTIIGEKGTVVIGGLAVNKILTWQFEDELDVESEVKKSCNEEVNTIYGSGHNTLYENMIVSIEQDKEPLINGSEGKKAMEIILAAYKSSKEAIRVKFPLTDVKSIDFKE